MSETIFKAEDAHYFTIPSQGNVYTLINIKTISKANKILVASLRRKIFLFDYLVNNHGNLKPCAKEIHFTYIPSGAEIISMDAFNKSTTCNDFVIGITIIKHTETYFNIYSESEPNMEFNIDQIAQNCFMLDLDFIPNHLYHTTLYSNSAQNSEIVWLLSGGDGNIHMYSEDKANHCYRESELENAFPEMNNASCVVMWMDVKYCQNQTRRVSAYGAQCGLVRFFLVSLEPLEVLNVWSLRSEGPISSIRFFTSYPPRGPNILKISDSLELKRKSNDKSEQDNEEENIEQPIHLLVTNTLEESQVFKDVVNQGLKEESSLHGSNGYDAVLCSLIADVDFDGENEILFGTYGQELLIYKFEKDKWILKNRRSFAYPIHSLRYVDLSGDGLKELVALTLKGVHIMQHPTDYVDEIFNSRWKNFELKNI